MLIDFGLAAALTTPIFLILLAMVVFAARPGDGVNRTAAVYLVLTGAADLMWFLAWSGSLQMAETAAHVGIWYEIPRHVLVLYLLHVMYPVRRPGLWRGVIMGVAIVLTLVLLGAFAADPRSIVDRVSSGADGRYGVRWGPLWPLLAMLDWAVLAVAVVVSARGASSPTRGLIERRQAAFVGMYFLTLAVFTGAQLGVNTGRMAMGIRTPEPLLVMSGVAGVSLLAVSGFCHRRILSGLDGSIRPLMRGMLTLALLTGSVGLISSMTTHWFGFEVPRAFRGPWRPLFSMGAAFLLALGFVRYGLAGLGREARRRITMIAHGSLAVTVLLIPAVLVLFLLDGQYLPAFAGAGLLVGVGTTFAPFPVEGVRAAMTRFLTVDPEGDAAMGERARRYQKAVRTRWSSTGRLPSPDDPALVALRQELGLGEDDHVRLSGLVEDAQALRQARPHLLGRYRVIEELGRGAFGSALLAVDQATGERVVIKRYHAGGMRDEALHEGRLLAQVRHPRVIPLLAIEEANDEAFLVLAHAAGGSLQDLLEREHALGPERAVPLAVDLLDALQALHEAGLAHRDVKPGNLLLDDEGRLLLADLGASRSVERRLGGGTLTAAPLIGSYATVAPEVLRGERAGASADVYATGALLYRMLTGEHYVDLRNPAPVRLMQAVLHEEPRIPHPLVPPALDGVLRCALEKDPGGRYADAGEMAQALEATLRAAR